MRAVRRPNRTLLLRVPVAIGRDSYGTGPWWEATPRAIFPGRRIGRLTDGYEASFLVLRRDPTESLDHLREIALRVKQGVRLEG